MCAPTDKRLKIISRRTVTGIALLLLFVLSCLALYIRGFWPAKQHQHTHSRMLVVAPSGELAVDANVNAEGCENDVVVGDDSGTPLPPLREQEQAALFAATSNLISACSNQDARAVRELSAYILDFMNRRTRQITAEVVTQVIGPIQQELAAHFRNPNAYKSFIDSKSAEELDARLGLEMNLVAFACAVNLEWKVGDIDAAIEGHPLSVISGLRNSCASESRDDMVVVCDKWIAKWQDRIDSEKGFYRCKLRETYLRGLEHIKNDRDQFRQGVYVSKEEWKQEVWQGVRDFGARFGYTPKWISEYAPVDSKSR